MGRSQRPPTRRTLEALEEVLEEFFGGSQLNLAKATRLDPGLVSRVLSGDRPASAEFVGAILRRLPQRASICLMTAFLNDVAAEAATGFVVRKVEITSR